VKRFPTFLMSMTLFSLVSVANAATLYVDNSKPCPGTGSAQAPYCKLALATSNRQCGDIVKVRTGARPYKETLLIEGPSCPGYAPIVVQADDGALPVLTSQAGSSVPALLHLVNVSNWHIEGLRFDGKRMDGNGTTTPQRALLAQARDVSVTGIVFRNNHVKNWALYKGGNLPNGKAIAFEGNQTRKKFVHDSLITENIIENVRGFGIYVSHARNSLISKNDISKLLCKLQPDGEGRIFPKVAGIKERNTNTTADDPSADTMDNVFEENVIHDLPDTFTCASESGSTDPLDEASVFGYWCDVGAKHGIVRRNKISNIGYVTEGTYYARGLLIESRCHGYTIEGNEIAQVGGPGIENRNANDTQISHNTLHNIRLNGVYLKDGARAEIKDNIFSSIRSAGVSISDLARQDGGHTIDCNLYDLVGQPGAIAGMTIPKTLAGWQEACQCDTHADTGGIFIDPDNGDFRLKPTNPAVGTACDGDNRGAN